MSELVIVGAGGFGREIIDVVDAINAHDGRSTWDVVGVVDDSISQTNLGLLAVRGVRHLGGTEQYLAAASPAHYVVGIGAPRVRRTIAERFDEAGHIAAVLVHPSATWGFSVEMGAGTVVCAGVRLTTNISLGRHVHLNLNATVGHDTTIGDFVSVNPLGSISGDVILEDDVLIGVGGVVLNRVLVGTGATVGGSACVVKNVSAGVVVKGVPAR